MLHEFAPMIVFETRMEPVFAPAMGDQAYLLRSPDEGALISAAARIQAVA